MNPLHLFMAMPGGVEALAGLGSVGRRRRRFETYDAVPAHVDDLRRVNPEAPARRERRRQKALRDQERTRAGRRS